MTVQGRFLHTFVRPRLRSGWRAIWDNLWPQVLGNDATARTLDRLVSNSDGLLHHISEGQTRGLGRLDLADGVKQLTVGTSADLVDDGGLQGTGRRSRRGEEVLTVGGIDIEEDGGKGGLRTPYRCGIDEGGDDGGPGRTKTKKNR